MRSNILLSLWPNMLNLFLSPPSNLIKKTRCWLWVTSLEISRVGDLTDFYRLCCRPESRKVSSPKEGRVTSSIRYLLFYPALHVVRPGYVDLDPKSPRRRLQRVDDITTTKNKQRPSWRNHNHWTYPRELGLHHGFFRLLLSHLEHILRSKTWLFAARWRSQLEIGLQHGKKKERCHRIGQLAFVETWQKEICILYGRSHLTITKINAGQKTKRSQRCKRIALKPEKSNWEKLELHRYSWWHQPSWEIIFLGLGIRFLLQFASRTDHHPQQHSHHQ